MAAGPQCGGWKLHGIPESKIESVRGDLPRVSGLGGESVATSSRIRAREATGALRILL
jgi:hypothetical protein